MSDFLTELNDITRSPQLVEYLNKKEHAEEIYQNMLLPEQLLKDFDDNLLENIKSSIKNKAFMGEYTELSNGHKKITGCFSLVKKHLAEYIGAYHFNGIKIDNKKLKMDVPFEANLIVYEPAMIKKFSLFKINGYKIYANTVIRDHIIKLLKNENIIIYKIENFPEDCEFVTIKNFQKKYINRTITFHYQIEY